ncbi:MAG TPA: AsmA family protein [Terriglobia bacterium]|nr:AsmA family protein [Terriglobia bacterium]
MSPGHRRTSRRVLIAVVFLGLAAWFLPSYVSVERYRRRLEAGLEQALKRPVDFGAVSLRLLPRPGFAIENVVVHEDPRFGIEPFAHVERIDCDLAWRSLLGSRFIFSRLHLDHPTFNVVRNAAGEWNVESLLRESGIASPARTGSHRGPPPSLGFDADGARVDFKVGDDKKSFSITDLRAQLNFEPSRGLLRYRLVGRPVRTDLTLPSPGEISLEGDWTPGRALDGPIHATLSTQRSLLYDWVPLVSGRNPEVYGVVNLTVRLAGSLNHLTAEGDSVVSQFYRWDLLPPSDSTRLAVHFQGALDRPLGRVVVDGADVTFGNARLHVAGSVTNVSHDPNLDLVFLIARSSASDLVSLAQHFWTGPKWLGASGTVDGLVAIRGPWSNRHLGGLMTARGVEVQTPTGRVAVADAALRVDESGVRLSPVRITLAPRLELVAEGAAGHLELPGKNSAKIENSRNEPKKSFRITRRISARRALRQAVPSDVAQPRYELTLTAKLLPLGDMVRFARSSGRTAIQGIEAEQGTVSGALRLEGAAWPPAKPSIYGRIEVTAARLLLPGLTDPLNIPQAGVRVEGDHVTVFPLEASLGGNAFTGRLEHEGAAHTPWKFDISTDQLSIVQSALWFEALGHRTAPRTILDLLPGLSSFDTRRAAAANLFAALRAEGKFHAAAITYRSLTLVNPEAAVEIRGRVVHVTDATFGTLGGRGHATLAVDLTAQPARISGEVALDSSNLQTLAPWLPASLEKLRGSASGNWKFSTTGLTRQEMAAHLEGEATLALKDVSFGDFDPLDALVEQCHWGTLEPARRRSTIRSANLALQVRGRRLMLKTTPFDLGGARLDAAGSYSFDGRFDVALHTDFTHLARHWLTSARTPRALTARESAVALPAGPPAEQPGTAVSASEDPEGLLANVHLAGPLDRLEVVPGAEQSRLDPSKD